MRTYYELAKPGIIYGNALPFMAAFILAMQPVAYGQLLLGLLGQSLIIGGSCVFNNVLDRNIDKRMERTTKRALVTGAVSLPAALIYGSVLCAAGISLLLVFTNMLTVLIGIVGIILYVLVYGYAKRVSPWSTLIGSIPGALPPVAGYAAAAGRLDVTALLLGLLLIFWQMPHFYAIALYRAKEYAAAKLPVRAVVASSRRVRLEIMAYIAALFVVVVILGLQTQLGLIYFTAAIGITAYWFAYGVSHWRDMTAPVWARQMFFKSLSVLLVLCAAIPAGVVIR